MTPEAVEWNRVPLLAALAAGCGAVPLLALGTVWDVLPGPAGAFVGSLAVCHLLALLLRRCAARLPAARRIALVSSAARVHVGPDRRISWRGATVWAARLAVAALIATGGLFLAGNSVGAAWFGMAAGYLHGASTLLDGLQEMVDGDLTTVRER